MNEQLSFFDEMPSNPPEHSLVLGVFPDAYTAERISHFGKLLRDRYGLHGKMRPTSHLHVSLPLPRGIVRVRKVGAVEIVSRACMAVAAATRPFEIRFDHAMSFQGKPGNRPLVLGDDNHGNDEVRNLHSMLLAEFPKYLSSAPKFMPHATLLYDKEEVSPKEIDPVYWTVKEIVLVGSEVGATKYHHLGRWAFGG